MPALSYIGLETKRDEVHDRRRGVSRPARPRAPEVLVATGGSIRSFEQDRLCQLQRLERMINAGGPAALRP
jgi:hypothetical protein